VSDLKEYPLVKKWKVEKVFRDSNHFLAGHVEDEFDVFLISGEDWWQAAEFFNCNSVKNILVEYEQ
jgi:hypothetical protein